MGDKVIDTIKLITSVFNRSVKSETIPCFKGLIPIITWCRQFPSVSTNILLIKSKSKLELKAFAVGVAMSPHNLGASIAGAPTLGRSRKCSRQVFFFFFFFFFFWGGGELDVLIELHQSGVIVWRPWQLRRSCSVFKNRISVAHCPFQRKWRVLHIWYISVLEKVGVSFNGMAKSMKV